MRKKSEQTLAEVLELMVKQMRWSQKINQVRLENIWQQEMGSFITRQTRSIALRQTVLHVEIESAPLRMELSYGKTLIIKKLNDALEEEYLTDVVFF